MARKPVSRDPGVALLRPAARPSDTFVSPGRSSLRDFATSLSKLDPELQEFLDARNKKQAEDDAVRGEAAFYENNSVGYAEAVRQGKVPAHTSPAFVKSYKKAQGSLAGYSLADRFWQDYDAWTGKFDEDADFDTYLSGWVKENVDQDDPDVLRGLLPHVRQVQQNGRAKYTEDRHKQVYGGHLDASVAGANRALDEANEAGLATEAGTDYPAVFANIASKREEFVSKGGRPEDFDKSMVDAMAAKVLSTRDPGLLGWFDQTIPGKDYTYGEDPYGAIVKRTTEDALEVIARRNVSEDTERQRKADEVAKDAAHRQAVEILAQDPAAPIPDGLLAEGMKYDPTFKVRIEEWRKNLGDGFSDPARIEAVYATILQGDRNAYKIVQDAFTNGAFGRPEDLAAAYSFAKSFEDNRTRLEDALGSSVSKTFLDALDIRTKGKNELMEPIAGMSNEGYEATYDFRRMVQEWVLANPDASLLEREEAINKIGKTILDRISEAGAFSTEGGTYERDAGAEFSNPFTAGTTPAPQPPPTPEEQEANEEVEDFINGLTEDQRTYVDQQAESLGMTREEFIKQTLGGGAGSTPDADPISYQPNEGREADFTPAQAESLITEALEATQGVQYGGTGPDPAADKLIDFIVRHEAGGNWNAVYGKSKSSRDLSKFTLNQVLSMQVAARRRGAPSTAIGGPQFIYKTLRSLKAGLGLTGDEPFTPKLQRQMAMQLLERRGWADFRAGKISMRQFAFRLAQEWASLPNPSTGRSYYAGDGLNASRTSSASVYRQLGFAVSYPRPTDQES